MTAVTTNLPPAVPASDTSRPLNFNSFPNPTFENETTANAHELNSDVSGWAHHIDEWLDLNPFPESSTYLDPGTSCLDRSNALHSGIPRQQSENQPDNPSVAGILDTSASATIAYLRQAYHEFCKHQLMHDEELCKVLREARFPFGLSHQKQSEERAIFGCTLCPARFVLARDRLNHVDTHYRPGLWWCKWCYQPFPDSFSLSNHRDTCNNSMHPVGLLDSNNVLPPQRERSIRHQFYRNLCAAQSDYDPSRLLNRISRNALLSTSDPASAGTYMPLLSPETSDSCETEDETELECWDIRAKLQRFRDDVARRSMLLGPVYNVRMRKDVRAYARVCRMVCVGLKGSCMLLDKDGARRWPNRPRKKHHQVPSDSAAPSASPTNNLQDFNFPQNQDDMTLWQPVEPDGTGSAQVGKNNDHISGYNSGYNSNNSAGSGKSASTRGSRRTRMPKTAGGYLCPEPLCCKVFNRACDLRHHQRNHQRQEERPYGCEQCEKRFLHKKDLRRHTETHGQKYGEKVVPALDVEDDELAALLEADIMSLDI